LEERFVLRSIRYEQNACQALNRLVSGLLLTGCLRFRTVDRRSGGTRPTAVCWLYDGAQHQAGAAQKKRPVLRTGRLGCSGL